jgi:hypothetical protein
LLLVITNAAGAEQMGLKATKWTLDHLITMPANADWHTGWKVAYFIGSPVWVGPAALGAFVVDKIGDGIHVAGLMFKDLSTTAADDHAYSDQAVSADAADPESGDSASESNPNAEDSTEVTAGEIAGSGWDSSGASTGSGEDLAGAIDGTGDIN